MKEFLKKGMSLLLAFSLLAGGMPLAAEEETDGFCKGKPLQGRTGKISGAFVYAGRLQLRV